MKNSFFNFDEIKRHLAHKHESAAFVTNDDGIESAFLHRFEQALLPQFRARRRASRGAKLDWAQMTRHGELEAIRSSSHFPDGVKAWAIAARRQIVSISPSGIAAEKPDIVLSGINIGFNTTESLILSSGTVAGAIEGVLWDLPAMAFSKCVPNHLFEKIRDAKGQTDGDFNTSLTSAAAHAARMAVETLAAPEIHLGTVVNVNFPVGTASDTPIINTFPAKLQLGSLFAETRPGSSASATRTALYPTRSIYRPRRA